MVPIFCINLATSPGRRRRMERRFAHHGLTEFIRFVDATTPDAAHFEYSVPEAGCVDGPTLRAAACFRSHLDALRRFLSETGPDVGGAIVMEDDVALHNDFVDRFHKTMANTPVGTPLVSLGYLVWHWDGIRWSGTHPEREDLATLHSTNVWGTQAYWISRLEAVRALDRLDRPFAELPTGVTSEAITRWSGGLIAYPPLVLEEAHDTTIAGPERLDGHRTAQRGFDVSAYSNAERETRDTTIALCMIVRNEEAVIERCLNSVRGLIDSWVICDTGSTDATVEVIRSCLAGISGSLHHCEWRDFGHNRSELMALALGTADHLLLMDADDTLEQRGLLPPLDSGVDAFRFRIMSGIEYEIPRLIRGDHRWRFEGRTHEYLTSDDGPTISELLPAWRVKHHGDGGSKSTKFERDRALLELTISERPDDERAVFYLAQTLEALDERVAAREHYRRRAGMGGFEEEAWYAQWRAAALLESATEGLGELLAAWSRRPSRLEPLHDAIELCAGQGWWATGHCLAAAGVAVSRPDDILFVHQWLYDGGLRADFARTAAALGLADSVSTTAEPAVVNPPLQFTGVPGLEELIASVRFARIDVESANDWPTFNPSVAIADGEVHVLVRSSNYSIKPDGSYDVLDDLDVVRTQNYWIRLTHDFAVVDIRPVIDRSHRVEFPTQIRGLEDCRLIRWDGRWWAVASARDSTAHATARILLLELDDSADDEVVIIAARELPSPHHDVHEKNWAPFVGDDQLLFLYGWHPRRVFRWDDSAMLMEVIEDRTDRVDHGDQTRWRGASQGVSVSGATIFVIHEVDHGPAGRVYTHRFVRLDSDGSTSRSVRFTLTGTPIEFVAGMALLGDDLVLSFGVNDGLAALAVVPLQAVDLLLEADRLT